MGGLGWNRGQDSKKKWGRDYKHQNTHNNQAGLQEEQKLNCTSSHGSS